MLSVLQSPSRLLRRLLLVLAAAIILTASLLAIDTQPADAQDSQTYRTCSNYGYIVGTGGQSLIGAAVAIRAISAPNPPGIDAALDTLIAFEDPAQTNPSDDDYQTAIDTLDGYYGPICTDLDVCPLVAAIGGNEPATAADAAGLLRGIGAPNPPGLDQAFFVVAGGDLAQTQIASYEAAQTQLVDYFAGACGGSGGSDGELAFTGPGEATRALSIMGFGLVAFGAAALGVRHSDRKWR